MLDGKTTKDEGISSSKTNQHILQSAMQTCREKRLTVAQTKKEPSYLIEVGSSLDLSELPATSGGCETVYPGELL
jgi:hypothetical protein